MKFVDARRLDDGSRIEADICIVGAGAAGITLARELAGGSLDVCLLESGGLTLDPKTQALYQGENVGWPYYALDVLRLRYFGGTTNHWSGVCRPLDPIDFAARDWVPHSGWPIAKTDLDPYYARAHRACQLGPYDYHCDRFGPASRQLLPLDPARLRTTMCQLSPPTRFGLAYGDDLRKAANVTTYLYANAVDFVPVESGKALSHVLAATLDGTRFTVQAKQIVLATGAIENVRLLMSARGGAGLANDSGLLGRYFMEHLSFPAGLLLPERPYVEPTFYTDPVAMHETKVKGLGYLTFPDPLQRALRLLNTRCWIRPADGLEALRGTSEAVESVFGLIGDFGDDHTAERLRDIAKHLDEVAVYGYRRLFRPEPSGAYWLYFHMEHPPSPDSRITLGDERDALGLRRVRLDWEIGELARQEYGRSVRLVAQELGRARVGRVKLLANDLDTGWPTIDRGLRGAWHQMGTTRMASDPKRGVVDVDCRVHGLDNLYIAGSSVFPTSGYTNPTLTIVAFAIRMADHLRSRFT